jgi:S1-C subfamily serine protease
LSEAASRPATGTAGRAVTLAAVALLAAAAGVFAGLTLAPEPTETADDLRAVYQRVKPAVVTVRTDLARLDDFESKGSGSGFHIGGGFYVTSAHVVEGGKEFFIDDGRVGSQDDQAASLVGADEIADLALLKAGPAEATLAWSEQSPEIGAPVIAVGNPFAEAPASLTSGIISGLERLVPAPGGTLAGMLQTDAAINPGNSGGPLLDLAGRVVGVNTAILSPSGSFAGIGYAVPAATARTIIEAIRDGRKVRHPSLGLIGDPDAPATVATVQPGSVATRAGLRAGDRLVAVAGQRVATLAEANAVIASRRPGEKVTLMFQRGGKVESTEVELD